MRRMRFRRVKGMAESSEPRSIQSGLSRKYLWMVPVQFKFGLKSGQQRVMCLICK